LKSKDVADLPVLVDGLKRLSKPDLDVQKRISEAAFWMLVSFKL